MALSRTISGSPFSTLSSSPCSFFIGGFAIGLVRLKLLSRAAGSWRPTSHGVGLLLLLFGLNVGPAYVPLGVGSVTLKLFIAAVMAIVVAVFLMDLRSSTTLIRILAITVCSGPS